MRTCPGSSDRVVQLLVTKYGVESNLASSDTTLASLGLDSLSVAEPVFDIDEELGIEISMDSADFETLREAVSLDPVAPMGSPPATRTAEGGRCRLRSRERVNPSRPCLR